jgi:hypothetical protein
MSPTQKTPEKKAPPKGADKAANTAPGKSAAKPSTGAKKSRNPLLLNGVLLLLSGLSFLTFANWQRLPWVQPAATESIARLSKGRPLLRTQELDEFVAAEAGVELRHLDAIWVPENGSAEIEFYDGKKINLKPRTLLVLRKPFRAPYDGEETAMPFRVLQGEAVAENFTPPPQALTGVNPTPSTAASPESSPEVSPEAPDASETPRPAMASATPIRPGVMPKPGATVFITVGQTTRFAFSWPDPITGRFELTETKSSKTTTLPLSGVKFVHAELAGPDSVYQWRITDPSGNPIEGPHELRVQKLSKERMSEILLKSQDPDAMIYVQ